jgi:hypothetical protein
VLTGFAAALVRPAFAGAGCEPRADNSAEQARYSYHRDYAGDASHIPNLQAAEVSTVPSADERAEAEAKTLSSGFNCTLEIFSFKRRAISVTSARIVRQFGDSIDFSSRRFRAVFFMIIFLLEMETQPRCQPKDPLIQLLIRIR